MEKTANVNPLERRRNLKIFIQAETPRRMPSNPLHTNLAQHTKKKKKKREKKKKRPEHHSLNHQYKELSWTHENILDAPVELLRDPV